VVPFAQRVVNVISHAGRHIPSLEQGEVQIAALQ
jgi:hypothetical protein